MRVFWADSRTGISTWEDPRQSQDRNNQDPSSNDPNLYQTNQFASRNNPNPYKSHVDAQQYTNNHLQPFITPHVNHQPQFHHERSGQVSFQNDQFVPHVSGESTSAQFKEHSLPQPPVSVNTSIQPQSTLTQQYSFPETRSELQAVKSSTVEINKPYFNPHQPSFPSVETHQKPFYNPEQPLIVQTQPSDPILHIDQLSISNDTTKYFNPDENAKNHQRVPPIAPVYMVDPTDAIVMQLVQSIPSLRSAPPPNSFQSIHEAYREYIRAIQDVQNTHTRAIRDAQVEHQRVADSAEFNARSTMETRVSNLGYMIPSRSGITSAISGVFSAATMFNQEREVKSRDLKNAKSDYERVVEHARQNLNDGVEFANRKYDDSVYNISKQN